MIHHKLQNKDLIGAGIGEYAQRYLKEKFRKPDFEYCIITYMLSYLLSISRSPRNQLVMVDYGAGSGIICLIAKALGIGTVIYSDIYDGARKDAEILGQLLGLRADYYVTGELSDVVDLLKKQQIHCDVLVSHDCIEHIYDIDGFIRQIVQIPTQSLAIWLSSAANPLRRKTRRVLSQEANKAEYENRESYWGHKDRDALRSYLSIRREIVRREAPELDNNEVEALGRKTRGMREDDIRIAVRNYVIHQELPRNPSHPTNTCDPYTGNWAERLMNPFDLAKLMNEEMLRVEVKPGFWAPQRENMWKNCAKTLTNTFIVILGKLGLHFAPYYVLCGVYTPSRTD